MSGDEDNRRMIARRDLLLQIKAVDVRQFNIKDEAGRKIREADRERTRKAAERAERRKAQRAANRKK